MEIGDYVLVIEDDEGNEIGRVRQTVGARPPAVGDETSLSLRDTNDARLVGNYRVRKVELVQDRDPPVVRRRYKIPICYVRRIPDRAPLSARSIDTPTAKTPSRSGPLSALDGGHLDAATIASLAQGYRDLATQLGELADETALALRSRRGQVAIQTLPQRLHYLSRVAKQVHARSLTAKLGPRRRKK